MNEDIKKIEISEEQLEGVSGGSNYPETCLRCGGKMIENGTFIMCTDCYHMVTIPPHAGDGSASSLPTNVP